MKKSTPQTFLILQETVTPKKFLIFSQKKAVLIFWDTFYFSGKAGPKKTSYISGSNFQSSKNKKPTLKKLLIFQEMELFNPKLEKNLIYQEGPSKSQV